MDSQTGRERLPVPEDELVEEAVTMFLRYRQAEGKAAICSAAWLQCPAGRADRICEAEAFEFHRSSEQRPAQFRVLGVRPRAQVSHAATFVGDIAQPPVEARPPI